MAIVTPKFFKSGNMSVATNATGTIYNAYAAQEAKQATVVNDTGTAVEVQQDAAGVAIPIADATNFTFYGLANTQQLAVRRKDTTNTPVTVKMRWEF